MFEFDIIQVETDNRSGSSLSNQDGDIGLEVSWDKEGEDQAATPTYLSSTASYLYPETFTGIPLKVVRYYFNTCPPDINYHIKSFFAIFFLYLFFSNCRLMFIF